MHVREAGAGPAVLFLHAFPLDGRMWRAQFAALQDRYRVLAPDLSGFGESPRPDGSPTLDDFAREIIAAMKERGVQRAVVAGCSIGGYLAFAMLRAEPRFITALALINTRASADTQDGRRARYEIVERARHEGVKFLAEADPPMSRATFARAPEIVAFSREMTSDATSVGVMAAQRAMAGRRDATHDLRDIRVPTIVVYGVDDPLIPSAEAESMATLIPGARLIPIADAGHLTPIEKPAEVSAAVASLAQTTPP